MSSIEKLMIQGIRSFGPEDKDRGFIQFYSPLTLILGPNGTGKTVSCKNIKHRSSMSIISNIVSLYIGIFMWKM